MAKALLESCFLAALLMLGGTAWSVQAVGLAKLSLRLHSSSWKYFSMQHHGIWWHFGDFEHS